MSNYENIIPEDIASNTFDFHGASIEIVADETGEDNDGHRYFDGDVTWSKNSLSHFVGIKSDRQLIINRCDFIAVLDELEPIQNFTIESSIDGETWDVLYTGTTPKVSTEVYKHYSCEFKPMCCKYIRCTFSSISSEIYNFCGGSFKFYGALSINQDPFLYTNPDDAYGIPKED